MPDQNATWNESQKNFYNRREHKRMWFSQSSFFVDNVLEKFIFFAGLTKDDKILEIGCGAGRYTIPLMQQGYQITGIDISERMLGKLKEDLLRFALPYDATRFICADLDSFPMREEGFFDGVIGFNVLHHLFDFSSSLKKVSSLVKRGGSVVFLEPNGRNPLHHLDTFLDRGWAAEHHKPQSRPENLRQSMLDNGFSEIECFYFGFFPPFVLDHVPSLLNGEKFFEKVPWLKTRLPYFIIKGTRI